MILSVEEGELFSLDDGDASHLAELLDRAITWRRRELQVWGVVGHVPLPSGTTLIIRSKKAPAACLLAWAAYCDPTLSDLGRLDRLDAVGDTSDVVEALAVLLVRELLAVTGAHGLRKRYRRVKTESANIRGAIDFTRLSQQGGNLAHVPCISWDRLRQTPLNQLLAAAVTRLVRDERLRRAVGPGLLELQSAFEGVAPRIDRELMSGRRGLERDEQPYGAALALTRLLLSGGGLATGESRAGLAFIVDLASLFERAVIKALKGASLDVTEQHPVEYERGLNGRLAFFVDAFVRLDRGHLVVDAKYKSEVSASNVQQMVTYCHLTGTERAALVFPQGQIADRRTLLLRRPSGGEVQVNIVEFDTSGRSIGAWRDAGARLGAELRGLER